MSKNYYIYILASDRNGTIYTGVTNNLEQRIHQHKNNFNEGFSKKYNVKTLVYFEVHEDVDSAVTRERNMKA